MVIRVGMNQVDDGIRSSSMAALVQFSDFC
jgi:hypothetical protein